MKKHHFGLKRIFAILSLAAAAAIVPLSARAQNYAESPYELSASYNAFHSAFLQTSDNWYGNTLTDHSEAFMWGQASDIFIDEDEYERTHSPATATLVTNLLNQFVTNNTTSWTWDSWNDDMEWGVLAFIRGYQITGNGTFLTIAENNWNAIYSRGWDTKYGGGGIWENMANLTGASADKCALSNDPFIIAGCWLYEATGNSTYLNESEADYSWVWNNIFNHTSSSSSLGAPGQVNEGVKWTLGQTNSGTLESSDNVYNSGSFLEAGNCLHQLNPGSSYINDEALDINHIVGEGPVMYYVGSPGNPQNQYWFSKGLSDYCTDNNEWSAYYSWLLGNANTSWANRDSDNLMEDDWTSAETNSNPACLNASSAVAIWPTLEVPQQYQIINEHSGLALDLLSGNEANNAPISQWSVASADANQDFSLAPGPNGSYSLINGTTGEGAAIDAGSTSEGAELVDWPYSQNNSSMDFNLISEGNGWYYIQNVNSGMVLDDDANGTANGTEVIQWPENGAANQMWKLSPVVSFGGEWEIQCSASGDVLDVSGASTSNGAAVIQWGYSGAGNQLWTFTPDSMGYYQIINVNSGQDLNVAGNSFSENANICQYAGGNEDSDQWLPVQNSNGTWTFYNLNSGLVLDDPGASTTAGTQFGQYQSNGTAAQQFTLISR